MSVYLITGGAGSLGRALVNKLDLTKHTVRVIDNSEAALAELKVTYPNTRCIYGDIRDIVPLRDALNGVDICIHAAALKNIDITEYNTPELLKTNVAGTENVLRACRDNSVKRLIFISSDKAVNPTTTYGTTKLMGEHLMKWAARVGYTCELITFRSGNFWSSNGNVFEVWARQVENNDPVTITHPDMERYFITLADAVKIILDSRLLDRHTVVPVMESFNIAKIARDRYPSAEFKMIPVRSGEKIEEEMWTAKEAECISKKNGWCECAY